MEHTDNLQIEDIRKAAERIRPFVHHTPVLTCRTINSMCRAEVFFKCENLQKIGAFKARGALNAVFSLPEDTVSKGVATHSSGNHAAAIAYAADCRKIRAYVVMPETASRIKKKAVAGYGARLSFCGPTTQDRERAVEEVIRDTGATLVHPYNDLRVICGQATAALELCEHVPGLDVVLAPVGGGGLLSGTALAVSAISPQTLVIGAEPERADDACRSFNAGGIIPVSNPDTIADGLRTSLGTLTFPIIRRHVQSIVTVSEAAIMDAMRLIWERMKLIVEASSAVPLAALLTRRPRIPGIKVGIILSGGNVDLAALPWQR